MWEQQCSEQNKEMSILSRKQLKWEKKTTDVHQHMLETVIRKTFYVTCTFNILNTQGGKTVSQYEVKPNG